MRNSDSGARASADNLVLTVRGDSPSRRLPEDIHNPNGENIPEPVFYVSPGEYKMVQSESALVAEIDALKLQLKMAKSSNLESKIIIEGCKNDLKDKIMVVKDLTSQMDKLRKKIKDQESMLEDQKRLVSEREEHVSRLYDQKMVAFKAQIAGLEEDLKASQSKHDAEVAKWVEIEMVNKKRLEKALADLKAKDDQIMAIEVNNQKLLAELNEQKKNAVEKVDATTLTSPVSSGGNGNLNINDMEHGGNMAVQMDMMNGMGMVPSSMMMPYAYSMASMMMANMEMSRMMAMSPWGMSSMMQSQPYQDYANVFPSTPQRQSGNFQMSNAQQQSPLLAQMQNCQTPAYQGVLPHQMVESQYLSQIRNNSDSKIETKLNQSSASTKGQNDQMDVVTQKTVVPNTKKRNYEEIQESDRAEKRRGQENQRDCEDLSSKAKVEQRVYPETPVSDSKRRGSISSRENLVGAKWVSDGNHGFKSVECSPDGHTKSGFSGKSRTLDLSTAREIRDSSRYRENIDNTELAALVKQRHLHPADEILFKVSSFFFLSKAFAKCSVLFPSQMRPRMLVEKGLLVVLVNHTADRSYPYRIVVTEPERGSRLMNVCMYDNVQIFQQDKDLTVKILHRRKGDPDSSANRSSKYILELRSEQEARLFYDTIFPPKEDFKE